MLLYFLLFFLSFLIALCLTPAVIRLALRTQTISVPNERSVHTAPKPLLGGLSIFFSFIVVYAAYELVINPSTEYIFVGILTGCVLIVSVGVMDDHWNLSPRFKLLGQLISTTPVLLTGLTLDRVSLPFVETTFHLGWLSIPITVIWIIGISNAINFMDGLDGLCGGVAAISCFSYFIVSFTLGNYLVAAISIILAGSILGFLKFNFHPAKIFMGDTGSLFLGFLLASLSLLELKQVAVTSFIIPLLILGVPISDTFYAMLRRKLAGVPMAKADKSHLHHRLLELGFSQRKTVWIIYGVSAFLSALAVFSTRFALEFSLFFLFFYIVFVQFLALKLGMVRPRRK